MSAKILRFEKPMSEEYGEPLERDLRQIQTHLMEINRVLGTITGALERGVEDRREWGRALGEFRDDLNELMALGSTVRELQTRVMKHEAQLEGFEKLRNQAIGARTVLHAIVGAAGGLIVLFGEFVLRWFNMSFPHR